jgi:hypothetical protein
MSIAPRATGVCGPWFMAVAGGFSAGAAWAQVYRAAYDQAQAALAPSRFQRACEPCWN